MSDLVGLFPIPVGKEKYLVVVVDYFTKWVEVEPLKSITTTSMARFEVPNVLVTDNGMQFNRKQFRFFCARVRIQNHFSSPATLSK